MDIEFTVKLRISNAINPPELEEDFDGDLLKYTRWLAGEEGLLGCADDEFHIIEAHEVGHSLLPVAPGSALVVELDLDKAGQLQPFPEEPSARKEAVEYLMANVRAAIANVKPGHVLVHSEALRIVGVFYPSTEVEVVEAGQAEPLVAAGREFVRASVAVWREIDALSQQPGGYHGLDSSTELRRKEAAAWESYRDLLKNVEVKVNDADAGT